MDITLLTERYAAQIAGVLRCWDWVLIFGTLPKICFAGGMTSYLYERKVRIFDYPRFAEPFRDGLKENAERLATESGLEIEYILKRTFRQEDRIKEVLARRGEQLGLVHIFSAMEPCSTYKPWHDKQTGRTFLKPDDGKCLRYYFYFIDEDLGLCYVRVPTWLPCQSQIYFNGHNWLAAGLRKRGIAFTLMDNALVHIDDWTRAQQIADELKIKRLHRRLDEFATRFCPIIAPSRKLDPRYEGEMENRLNVRIEGTRIKHTMGPCSLKLYDKFGLILRIETTVNDLTFFKHYREVEHRDGSRETKWAAMQKTIYSLPALHELLQAANHRHLEFLSTIEDPRNLRDKFEKLSQTVQQQGRSYPGFNFFDQQDEDLFCAIARGEFNISGMQNKTLRRFLSGKTSSQVSRLLKRLRLHGLIKRIGACPAGS